MNQQAKSNKKYDHDHPSVVTSRKLRAEGLSYEKIGRIVGLNEGQIWRFVNNASFDTPVEKPPAPARHARVTPKVPPVRVQGMVIKMDDGRPVVLHSVTREPTAGGGLYVVTVFVPESAK